MAENVKFNDVFFENLRAYRSGSRYIINQGSARSGKSWAIMQLLHMIAHGDKARVISVVSKTLPHLRRGVLRDFLNYLKMTGQYDDAAFNSSLLIYNVKNSIIEFFSTDQPEKVYGPGRDILFCNQIDSIDEEIFRHLAIRTREQIFVDYNPTSEFYIIKDYKNRDNAAYIHTTYKGNKFLPSELIRELEETGERNANFKRVFVEGEVGHIEGVIFENWEFGEFDITLPYLYGQDYGFVNDPTTLVKVAIDSKHHIIYADEIFYKTGLSTNAIYELNSTYAGNNLIIGDSAEPRLISELAAKGCNIRPAVKQEVKKDIAEMLDYKIVITERSTNLERELNNYIWLDSDKKTNVPIDAYNHVIDAMRYAFRHLNRGKLVIA